MVSESAFDTIRVSFIVPLFNHLAETQAMVESLRASIPANLAHEIILVDDFSMDGTRDWLATLDDPAIKTLFNPRNMGYAMSNNLAVKVASGEILALLNNDLLLRPGWLEPMLAVLTDPACNAGLVGNLQFGMHDNNLDHAGVFVTPSGKIEHLREIPDARQGYRKVFAVTGACCLVWKDIFKEVGGFDEGYVNGGEDVDLCLALRQRGQNIYVAVGSIVRHHVSLSRDRENLQNERNSQRIYLKWRREIKNEVARQWVARLVGSAVDKYDGFPDGDLAPALRETPHALARVIAECVLRQEEAYWSRHLDGADPNADLAGRCAVRGVRFSGKEDGYLLEGVAEVSLTGVTSLRNFFVCGRKSPDMPPRPVALTISVNGIQEKTFVLGAAPNINVGLIQPILLQGVANRFRVSAHFINPKTGQRTGDAGKFVVITHFVVDDQMVGTFSGRATPIFSR